MNAARREGWWWWVAAALVLGNCLMYMHLTKKIVVLQESLAAMDSRLVLNAGTQGDGANVMHASTSPRVSPTVPSPGSYNVAAAISRIQQFKERRSSIDPVAMSADLNNRMSGEPALPEIEQRHSSWLNDTLAKMPADAPDAGSLQTTCEGRRCLVSAAFASEDDAREWGTRYLLEGGGRLLQHSSTVIVPLGGTDHSVALQLYLY